MGKNSVKTQDGDSSSLRTTISDITAELITELREAELLPVEKIALLKALLPYSVGKLPNALVNFQVVSGQPTSARIIELSDQGGRYD